MTAAAVVFERHVLSVRVVSTRANDADKGSVHHATLKQSYDKDQTEGLQYCATT